MKKKTEPAGFINAMKKRIEGQMPDHIIRAFCSFVRMNSTEEFKSLNEANVFLICMFDAHVEYRKGSLRYSVRIELNVKLRRVYISIKNVATNETETIFEGQMR